MKNDFYDYLEHTPASYFRCSPPDIYGRYVHLRRKKYKPRNRNKKRWWAPMKRIKESFLFRLNH